MDPPAAAKRRTPLLIAGLACGGCLLIVVLATVAGGLFVNLGLGVFSEQVQDALHDNPVVVEHLGMIDDLSLDFGATLAVPGEDEFVFEVQGSKANGTLRVTSLTVDDETEEVVAGTLQLESGVEFDLFPESPKRLEAKP